MAVVHLKVLQNALGTTVLHLGPKLSEPAMKPCTYSQKKNPTTKLHVGTEDGAAERARSI